MVDTNKEGKTEYWKLHKALYGLKQAEHEWYQMLRGILKDCILDQAKGDLGCFYKQELIIGTHINDLLAIRTKEELDKAKEEI